MTFGFSRDDVEGRLMPRYLEEGLLPRNPFETIDHRGRRRARRAWRRAGPRRPSPASRSASAASTAATPSPSPSSSGRPRLRVVLAVPGARRPPGRRPGHPRHRRREGRLTGPVDEPIGWLAERSSGAGAALRGRCGRTSRPSGWSCRPISRAATGLAPQRRRCAATTTWWSSPGPSRRRGSSGVRPGSWRRWRRSGRR